jgi:hypothetical protein
MQNTTSFGVNLFSVQESETVFLFYDLSRKSKLHQDPVDEKEKRVPFVAYIGGFLIEELKAIAEKLEPLGFKTRKSKRLTQFPFEVKLQGVKWERIKQFAKEKVDV